MLVVDHLAATQSLRPRPALHNWVLPYRVIGPVSTDPNEVLSANRVVFDCRVMKRFPWKSAEWTGRSAELRRSRAGPFAPPALAGRVGVQALQIAGAVGPRAEVHDDSAKTWLYGRLFVALLVEKLVHHDRTIPPGYDVPALASPQRVA